MLTGPSGAARSARLRVGNALANPARLELLDLLAQGERSVEDLAETAQMKVSNTSAQLRMLAGAGLVASRRYGVRIYYRLADESLDERRGVGVAVLPGEFGVERGPGDAEHQVPGAQVRQVEEGVEVVRHHLLRVAAEAAPVVLVSEPARGDLGAG
ncbi:MAG TPA: metalloregulator ArsR/SmtB family transcription factor [Trebonia sp.]|nr:metalloregulator ArsR/SmtB family transcription factor [Trebonia sp.]